MKILVTGGAGFLGSHLADKFINNGDEVFGIDNLSGGYIENVNSKVNLLIEDLKNFDKIKIGKNSITVQPGIRKGKLDQMLVKYGKFFGPNPSGRRSRCPRFGCRRGTSSPRHRSRQDRDSEPGHRPACRPRRSSRANRSGCLPFREPASCWRPRALPSAALSFSFPPAVFFNRIFR